MKLKYKIFYTIFEIVTVYFLVISLLESIIYKRGRNVAFGIINLYQGKILLHSTPKCHNLIIRQCK